MKQVILAVVLVGGIMFGVGTMIGAHIVASKRLPVVVYTTQDIYYLKNTTLSTESGAIQINFRYRKDALEFLETRTALDSSNL